ncbi:MAG TPA: hypothetical protein VD970_17550 [Acetobacteraceae bacterium]|nr:hypothetical protein [Acetobacteraceae bacterium]
MSSRLLRRAALAIAATGAILTGTAGSAEAYQTYVVTRVYRPAPVVVYRPYRPPVVVYRAPIVRRYVVTRY